MTAPKASGDANRNRNMAYKDKCKPTDVRSSNINAAKGKFIHIFICNKNPIFDFSCL